MPIGDGQGGVIDKNFAVPLTSWWEKEESQDGKAAFSRLGERPRLRDRYL